MKDKRLLEMNRDLWDIWTKLHAYSKHYDVQGFLNGNNSLKHIELAEVGSIKKRSILHLQCHFGLDSINWARRGAIVTGVDFSPKAIAFANHLKTKVRADVTFICSDIYHLRKRLKKQFDIVFTSYGVLSWLPDLRRWAGTIAHFTKPGGLFYIVEFHPLFGMLSKDGKTFAYPYFHSDTAEKHRVHGSYACPSEKKGRFLYQWAHSLEDIVTALVNAGLSIEFLHEFPYSPHKCCDFLRKCGREKYALPSLPNQIPLTFSIRARKS